MHVGTGRLKPHGQTLCMAGTGARHEKGDSGVLAIRSRHGRTQHRYRGSPLATLERQNKSRLTWARRSAFVGLAALVLLACGQEQNGGGGRRGRGGPVSVRLETVQLVQDVMRIEAVGTARARASVTIYAEAGGEVTEVLFEAGDFVEAGQPLLRLEDTRERLAVRLAEVSVRVAEQLLARYRRIENTGAVSDSQIDEARTTLESAKLQLEQAQENQDQRTVVAPFAGHVGLTTVDPGARITPTTVITQLDDREVLYIDFEAPEQAFQRLIIGTTVTATPFSAPDRSLEATVVYVASQIEPQRRTFTVRAELDNAEDIWRPGMSFEINVAFPGQTYPAVPEVAILWGSDGSYLWAIRDGEAQREPVAIVARREGTVLVDGALGEGDQVVVEGVQKVRQGSRVQAIGVPDGSAEPAQEERP